MFQSATEQRYAEVGAEIILRRKFKPKKTKMKIKKEIPKIPTCKERRHKCRRWNEIAGMAEGCGGEEVMKIGGRK